MVFSRDAAAAHQMVHRPLSSSAQEEASRSAVEPSASPLAELTLSPGPDRRSLACEIAVSSRSYLHSPPREYAVREDQRNTYTKAFEFRVEKNAPVLVGYEHRPLEGELAAGGFLEIQPNQPAGAVPMVSQLNVDRSHPRFDLYNAGIFPEFDGVIRVQIGEKIYEIDSSPALKTHL